MTTRKWLRVWAVAALSLAAGAARVSAQITTGNVTGTVRDAQGGVVPGATVTLIDEARGTKLAPAVTDGTGKYIGRHTMLLSNISCALAVAMAGGNE